MSGAYRQASRPFKVSPRMLSMLRDIAGGPFHFRRTKHVEGATLSALRRRGLVVDRVATGFLASLDGDNRLVLPSAAGWALLHMADDFALYVDGGAA